MLTFSLTARKSSTQSAVHVVSKTKVIRDSSVVASFVDEDGGSLLRRCYIRL